MAATIAVRRWTGASAGTESAARTAIRSSSSDNDYTTETTNPIVVPASSSNYGYWVSTRLNASVLPAGTANNLRWYTDGTNNYGTGVTMAAQAANVGANSGYRAASGTPGTTGDVLNTSNHTGLTTTTVDPFGLTVGSPKSLTGTVSSGGSTGAFGDYFVYQHIIASTASQGTLSGETFTWKWDET